jgi:hypothetical protein
MSKSVQMHVEGLDVGVRININQATRRSGVQLPEQAFLSKVVSVKPPKDPRWDKR